jgi:hypothetical protein
LEIDAPETENEEKLANGGRRNSKFNGKLQINNLSEDDAKS